MSCRYSEPTATTCDAEHTVRKGGVCYACFPVNVNSVSAPHNDFCPDGLPGQPMSALLILTCPVHQPSGHDSHPSDPRS
eukprot:220850-Lingulodinium_polyedra.AAC.1